MSNADSTLVIGAGLSGMTCARRLADAGHAVTVVDKGRRPSGRLATRTSRSGPVFDHGAQFFTARLDGFRAQVRDWVARGVAAEWKARIVDLEDTRAVPTKREAARYVGTPGMDAVVADLCRPHPGIDGPHFGLQIARLDKTPTGYEATTADGALAGSRSFDQVVLAIPGAQARTLLADLHPDFATQLDDTDSAACWAAMLAFDQTLDLGFDAAFVEGESPLSWIARNTAKPGRPDTPECWVLHTGPKWSQKHVDFSPDEVLPQLIKAFAATTGTVPPETVYAAAHRWRFAHVTRPLSVPFLHDAEQKLAACGDVFCTGPRPNIEQAWHSGHDLASALLDSSE